MTAELHSSHPVLMLFETPTRRQRMARRRRSVIAGLVLLAVASGTLGWFSRPNATERHDAFIYYPSE